MTSPYDPSTSDGRAHVPDDTVLPPNRPGRAESRRASGGSGSGGGSPVGKVLLVLGVVAVCVLALFGALLTLRDDGAPVAAPTSTPTTPAASETPSASASASPPASASASPTRSASPSRTATPSPSASTTKAAFDVDRSVPVTVLNGTSRTGLAARVAADLRAKGWKVVSIGNWRGGGVDSTTVFVVGNRDAAATMRRDVPSADLTTRPIGLMKRDRITLVVMGDYRA